MIKRICLCLTVILFLIFTPLFSQKLSGIVVNEIGEPAMFIEVALFQSQDSSLYKLSMTDDNGYYDFDAGMGSYYLKFVGLGW